MIVWGVLVALAIFELVEAYLFAGALKSQARQQARERERLIDQILHLSGRTWTPPPGLPDVSPADSPMDWGQFSTSVDSDIEEEVPAEWQ